MSKHVPNPNRFLDRGLVEDVLAACANRFVAVTFLKVDGELRHYAGQLRATSRLVGNERGQRQGEAMRARGQVWLARPDGGSKSFYVDRVLGMRVDGKTYGTPPPHEIAAV